MSWADHWPRPPSILDGVQTLPALFGWRVEKTPHQEAYREFDRNAERWIGYSWRELDKRIEPWRRALDAEQLKRGERVAIMVPNGIEHVSMDQAALSRG